MGDGFLGLWEESAAWWLQERCKLLPITAGANSSWKAGNKYLCGAPVKTGCNQSLFSGTLRVFSRCSSLRAVGTSSCLKLSLCNKHRPVRFAGRVRVCLSKFKCRLVISPNLLFLAFVVHKCKPECDAGLHSYTVKIYL